MAKLNNNYDKENNSAKDVEQFLRDENSPQSPKQKKRWWVKAFWIFSFLIIGLLVGIFLIINSEKGQNWIAQKAMQKLNEDFKTEMKIDQIDIDFWGDITIKDFKVTDKKGLDFIKAKELKANSDWYKVVKGLVVEKKNAIYFNALSLKEADIKVITYKGEEVSNFIRYVQCFSSGEKDPNKPPFQFDAKIKILNSKVSIVNQNSEGDAGKWLDAKEFNLVASDLKVKGVDISANIDAFNFVTERWGKKHQVKELTGRFHLTKDFLEFPKVKLHTDHTLLKGKLKFNLNKGTWQDFVNKVVWEMDLRKGSYFSGYDISYFVTQWDNYKPIYFNGEMKGALNDFQLKNFQVNREKMNLSSDFISFKKVLGGNFMIATPNLKTNFTYKELKASLPSFIAVKLKNFADDFGRLKYTGAVRVTPTQVYIQKGTLNSDLGYTEVKELYLTDYTTPKPKYKGFVRLKDLDASLITKNDAVKKISGEFTLNGQSFDVNNMVLNTRSKISTIEILGKEVNNVVLDGVLDAKKYTGIISINDKKIKANVDGVIDFSTSRINADVKGYVQDFHLNYFTGNKTQQILNGGFDGKIAMTDLNDLQLDTVVRDVYFKMNDREYVLEDADVKAFVANGERMVFIDAPNLVRGQIKGRFNLADLSSMIENGLNKILISNKKMLPFYGQQFTINFDVEQALVKNISPELKLPKGGTIKGEYIGDTNDLILNLSADQLKYIVISEKQIKKSDEILAQLNEDYKIKEEDKIRRDSLMIDQISLNINTTKKDKQIDAEIDRIEFKQNVFQNTKLVAHNNNDEYLDIVSTFEYGSPEDELEGDLQSFAFNFKQSIDEKGDYVIDFKPTQIQLENEIWTVNTDQSKHSIVYQKDKGVFLVEYLNLTSDESQIIIKETVFENAKNFQADIEVENFEIGKVFNMLDTGNTMNIHGIANGMAKVIRHETKLEPIVNIEISDLKMSNQEIGNLVMHAKNSGEPNVYDVDATIIPVSLSQKRQLNLLGTIDNNPKIPVLDIKAELNDFDIRFANQFVEGVFSNMKGKASGVLNINGALNDIDYNGDIALKEAGLKLDFVGVDYRFDDTVINLSKGLAQLNNVGIKDGRTNSKGTISGVIQFETLASMSVALFLRADNLLLLNTTQNDFDLFWGRVYAKGTLFVDGAVKALNLTIPEEDAMEVLDNSVFTFNSQSSSNVEEFKMLRFLQKDEDGAFSVAQQEKTGPNINVDFTASVGKGTQVNVLVGDDIGDIAVRGKSEKFNFKMTRAGNLSMDGEYTVESGSYVSKLALANFKIEKTFQIEKDSRITWDGDVMRPNLDITANYLRSISNVGEYLNIGQGIPSIGINLETKITGTLENPVLGFDIEAVGASSQVQEALATKLNQGEERVLQFGSVLLFDSFNVSDTGGFGVNMASVAEAYAYNLVLKRFSSAFNTFSNDFQTDITYTKGNEAYNIGDRVNVSLSYLFSPRFQVKGTLGIPVVTNQSLRAVNNYFSQELNAEYDIAKNNDGSLLLRAYTKPTDIGMLNTINNQTYGVGIGWRKQYDLFFKDNEKLNPKNPKNKGKSIKDSIQKD